MEKNGFIFIKQNFEMFEGAEPTLTEISDGDGQAKNESSSAGVQTDVQAKNVVKIIDSGKTVRVSNKTDLPSTKAILENLQLPKLKKMEGKTVGKSVNILGGKKRHTSNQNDKSVLVGLNGQVATSKSAPVIVNPVETSVSAPVTPVQLVKAVPAPMFKQDTLQLVQLVQGGMIPVAANNGPIQIVPITIQAPMPLPGVLQPAPVLAQTNIKTNPVTITASKMVNHDTETKSLVDGNFSLQSSYGSQVLESQVGSAFITKVSPIDEKGDNCVGLGGQQLLTATPVVSDAPWQGVLNINSEQELLEYINSQSMSGEGDKNLTILIQNVDGPGGGVAGPLALDNQMLSGISGLGEGFVDQGLIMSDVLPTVSNVEEVHLNTDGAVTLTDNMTLLNTESVADIPIKTERDMHIGESSVVFSSVGSEIPPNTLSIDDDVKTEDNVGMIISEDIIHHSGEDSNVQVTVHVKQDTQFSNCDTEHFSEHVTLMEPTMADVCEAVEMEPEIQTGPGDIEAEPDEADECDSSRKGLYTDHDFYSVPIGEVDHEEDQDQTESQCYNDSVMLNTEEVTLEDPGSEVTVIVQK